MVINYSQRLGKSEEKCRCIFLSCFLAWSEKYSYKITRLQDKLELDSEFTIVLTWTCDLITLSSLIFACLFYSVINISSVKEWWSWKCVWCLKKNVWCLLIAIWLKFVSRQNVATGCDRFLLWMSWQHANWKAGLVDIVCLLVITNKHDFCTQLFLGG